ncbi:MAG TPA: ferritin-like domain-containing protein [Kofleriaceae bacterium]|nr:ferritin-like domain-containing protein [Kofleriaceae bacterium]
MVTHTGRCGRARVAATLAVRDAFGDFTPAAAVALDPDGLATRSHAQYGTGARLEELIKEDLIAERIAIATYSEIVRWLGADDPTTRRLMEELLAKEEEHADDMAKLLSRVSK